MEDWKTKYDELNKEIDRLKKKHIDFLEAASHDLHAPLRKIAVFTDRIVEKNAIDNNSMQYIGRIKNSVAEMQYLIDNLTNLALVNSEPTHYTDCDLNSLMKKVLFELQEEIEQKKVEIYIESLPVVKADPIQYKQLFLNIIGNAIKFSKQDPPPKIDITSSPLTDEERLKNNLVTNTYFKIVISDNGIGFAHPYAEKIFEPFVRLHAKTDYPGTGLGLSIAKKIVENHNGMIYAIGTENAGAQFILILPANP